jgi:hypothetical protein
LSFALLFVFVLVWTFVRGGHFSDHHDEPSRQPRAGQLQVHDRIK